MDNKQPRRLLEPLKLRNYRDAAKYHCHLPGKYRKTAHNACNINLRIRPEESRRHKDKVYTWMGGSALAKQNCSTKECSKVRGRLE